MSQEKNNTPETSEEPYEGILGDYTEDETAKAEPEQSEPVVLADGEKPEKKSKKKGLAIAGISAAVVLIACLGAVGVKVALDKKADAALSTEHYTVTKSIMACYYHDMISMLTAYYGEDMLLSYYQLDVNQPLKDQAYPTQDGTTWFDNVMKDAVSTCTQQLLMAEAGKAAGYVLSDASQQIIEDTLNETDLSTYAEGVTMDDVRAALEIQAYASEYYNEYMNSLMFTDEEVQAYFDANKNSYVTCGLLGFSISYDNTVIDRETGEELPGMTQEQAETLANKLMRSKTEKEFEDTVSEILIDYEGYNEENVEQALLSIRNTAFAYNDSSEASAELSNWAFNQAKVGEMYMLPSSNMYNVYMLTDLPVRDESTVVDVRHILFKTDDHVGEDGDTDAALEECRQLAQNCLDEWKQGDMTEDSFAELAGQYTEDTGSKSTGGLYTSVYEGQMVPTFNDWCFDVSRQTGDTGLVESDYGVHVMYFVKSDEQWRGAVKSTMQQEAYNNWYAELEEAYPVTTNQETIDSIEG